MKKLALLFILVACSKSNVKWSEINALRTESSSYTLNFADESLVVRALDGVGPFTFNATGPGSWIQSGNSFSYQRTWNKGTNRLTISDAAGFSTHVNVELKSGILKLGGDNTSGLISGSSSQCMSANLNSSGNLVFSGYTTGVFNSSSLISPHGAEDAYVAKLKTSGAIDWIAQFGADNYTTTYVSTQKTDNSGNVYAIGFTNGELYSHFPVTGSLTGSVGNKDLFIAKFNQSGVMQWLRQIGGSGGVIESNGLKVLQDQNKDIYIAGTADIDFGATQIGVAGSYNVFVLKINKDTGSMVWSYSFGGGLDSWGNPAETNFIDFGLDSSGNIFVYGDTNGDQVGGQLGIRGSRDVFLAKIDNSGTFQWSKQFGANDQLFGRSLFLSSSGKVLATGLTGVDFESVFSESGLQLKTTGSSDAFLLQFSANGNLNWKRQMGGGSTSLAISKILENAAGDYVFAGTVTGNVGDTMIGSLDPGSTDVYISRLTSSANLLWTRQLSGGSGYPTNLTDIELLSDGDFVLLGATRGNLGGNQYLSDSYRDLFIARLDSSGLPRWISEIGPDNYGVDYPNYAPQLRVNSTGDFLAYGTTGGRFLNSDLTVNPSFQQLGDHGYTDVFFINFSETGNFNWGRQLGGLKLTVPKEIYFNKFAFDQQNNAFMCGATDASFNLLDPSDEFNGLQVGEEGTLDAAIFKLSSDGELQ